MSKIKLIEKQICDLLTVESEREIETNYNNMHIDTDDKFKDVPKVKFDNKNKIKLNKFLLDLKNNPNDDKLINQIQEECSKIEQYNMFNRPNILSAMSFGPLDKLNLDKTNI